jgi:hypothetical protein
LPGTLTIAATVDKDTVTGTTEGTLGKATIKGTVSGWLRSDQELRKADPVAAEPGWPTWSGPDSDFSSAEARHALVEDLFQAPLMWASEELIWGARGSPPGWQVGGYSSSIVGGGKVFVCLPP